MKSNLATNGETSNHYPNISEYPGNDLSETRLEDMNESPKSDLNCEQDSQVHDPSQYYLYSTLLSSYIFLSLS